MVGSSQRLHKSRSVPKDIRATVWLKATWLKEDERNKKVETAAGGSLGDSHVCVYVCMCVCV